MVDGRDDATTSRQSETDRLVSGLRLVGLCTLASRVMGLARDTAMAVTFGNSSILDAFTVAFRIPNMARRLFGEGAFTAAFLPIFVEEIETNGEQRAWRMAATVLAVLAAILLLLVVLGEVTLGVIWLSGDFGADGLLLLGLTAILMPYLFFICLSAQVSAVLNARDHFFWPAVVPVILNLVWLLGVGGSVLLANKAVPRMYFIAAAIVGAGVLQLAAPLPTLHRLGFRLRFDMSAARDALRRVAASILPVVVGLSITQLNTLVDAFMAWGLSHAGDTLEQLGLNLEAGTASALYFGSRMYQFPLGVFGIALSTVVYPRFSRHAARRDTEAMRKDFELSFRLILLIGIPATAGLVLMADPLARLLFQYGAFSQEDGNVTARMIAAYGLGVWAYCALLIINRVFYAVGDQQTPLRTGIVAFLANVPLSLALVPFIGAAGLAVSTSICAAFQAALMVHAVRIHVGNVSWRAMVGYTARVVMATTAMSMTVLASLGFMRSVDWPLQRLLVVAVPIGLAVAVYLPTCRLLRLDELKLLYQRKAGKGDY